MVSSKIRANRLIRSNSDLLLSSLRTEIRRNHHFYFHIWLQDCVISLNDTEYYLHDAPMMKVMNSKSHKTATSPMRSHENCPSKCFVFNSTVRGSRSCARVRSSIVRMLLEKKRHCLYQLYANSVIKECKLMLTTITADSATPHQPNERKEHSGDSFAYRINECVWIDIK